MKTEIAPYIKSPPLIWIEPAVYQESIWEKIEYIAFHALAFIACIGGGFCLTVYLLLKLRG